MPDDAMSKRDRQKARRAERLAAEAKAAQAAQRNRRIVLGVVIVLVVGAIGYLIANQVLQGRAQENRAEEVAARLGEFGCTPEERMPDLGGGHLASTPEELAANPPEVLYPDRPPSSGRHVGQVVASGVYDVFIDERITLHNLEHGYVNVLYNPEAPEEQVAAMTAWVEDQMAGNRPKMVVAPWYGEFPPDVNFIWTAWFQRQMCRDWFEDALEVFATAHYGIDGEAPEKTVEPHTAGAQGVLVPEEGQPLLLPPLDTQFGADSAIEEASEVGTAPNPSASPEASAAATATDAATDAATASGEPTATESATATEAATEPEEATATPSG